MNLSAELQSLSIPKNQKQKAELEALVYELEHRWDYIGRESQQEPQGIWDVWALIAGRGFGKTRTGSEITRKWSNEVPSILLIGATSMDMRDIMIDGPSGILATAPRGNYPLYEPSKLRLTWRNGCICHLRSADEPDRIRGVETYRGWLDEFAAWNHPKEAWDMVSMAIRKGDTKKLITTTPRRLGVLKKIIGFPGTVITHGSTYENIDNLSESFRKIIIERYEGTQIGRQEIYAEILDDVEGALWTTEMIDQFRTKEHPDLKRIIVAIDPAVTSKPDSDETGIIVAGKGIDNHGYILHDSSGKFTPNEWAKRAIFCYEKYKADRIVAEVNNGGDLVEANIRTIKSDVPYKSVYASRGKVIRAEPIVALYEQGKIHHIGIFDELEKQMTNWNPEEKSPDRLDALVWALTELMIDNSGQVYTKAI
jgi:predicted phage terminase large subunit-like protein